MRIDERVCLEFWFNSVPRTRTETHHVGVFLAGPADRTIPSMLLIDSVHSTRDSNIFWLTLPLLNDGKHVPLWYSLGWSLYLNASEQSRKCGNNSYSNVVANRSHMEPAIRIFFLWLWCSNDNQKWQVPHCNQKRLSNTFHPQTAARK